MHFIVVTEEGNVGLFDEEKLAIQRAKFAATAEGAQLVLVEMWEVNGSRVHTTTIKDAREMSA